MSNILPARESTQLSQLGGYALDRDEQRMNEVWNQKIRNQWLREENERRHLRSDACLDWWRQLQTNPTTN